MTDMRLGLRFCSFANRILGGSGGLRVRWFARWNAELDAALAALPNSAECPHELFRAVARNASGLPKSIALVTDGRNPVAVIALRRQGPYWVPITQWMLPGAVFPSLPGAQIAAAAALGIEMEIGWWRMHDSPPRHPFIRQLVQIPTYRMPCSADPDEFWRVSGKLRQIEKARKKCAAFTVQLDPPEGIEWIITHWADKWASSVDDYSRYVDDRLVVARHLACADRFHTLLLFDHDTPVSGESLIVHGDELVLSYNYRDPAYDAYHVGTRILDAAFNWAAASRYTKIDLGGGEFDYKIKWAPQDGARWKFIICPGPASAVNTGVRVVKNFGSRLHSTLRRAPADNTAP